MLFASQTAFKFKQTSRKDDLESLIYILIFLLDLSRLTFINDVQDVPKNRQFEIIKSFKVNSRARVLCGTQEENSPAHFLTNFVKEVQNLEYESKPPYSKLR